MSTSPPPPTLIPGLPNHISTLILSLTPFPYFPLFKQVCKPWRKFFTCKTHLISSLRSLHHNSTLSHLICIFPSDPSLTSSFLFDPFLLSWSPPLPPLPINPHTYSLSNFSAVSLGPAIYILGGSLFDARSFPLDVPCSSNKLFKFDVISSTWQSLPPMRTPRGSFACGVGKVEERGYIMVAGGGSRHRMFMAAGSRVEGVERYDVEKGVWEEMEGLPGERAGCEGFWVKGRERGEGGEKMEFWVMGGYGEGRTISGVLPVDEFYKDAVVMEGEGGKWRWREVGDMWKDGERVKLGKVAVLEDEDGGGVDGEVGVFMLDENRIFRYSMALNRWFKESTVPRVSQNESSFGFVALKGELYVISLLEGVDLSEVRRSRQRRRGTVLFMQIYNPRNKSWRSLVTRSPFGNPVDFKTAVICTVRV